MAGGKRLKIVTVSVQIRGAAPFMITKNFERYYNHSIDFLSKALITIEMLTHQGVLDQEQCEWISDLIEDIKDMREDLRWLYKEVK